MMADGDTRGLNNKNSPEDNQVSSKDLSKSAKRRWNKKLNKDKRQNNQAVDKSMTDSMEGHHDSIRQTPRSKVTAQAVHDMLNISKNNYSTPKPGGGRLQHQQSHLSGDDVPYAGDFQTPNVLIRDGKAGKQQVSVSHGDRESRIQENPNDSRRPGEQPTYVSQADLSSMIQDTIERRMKENERPLHDQLLVSQTDIESMIQNAIDERTAAKEVHRQGTQKKRPSVERDLGEPVEKQMNAGVYDTAHEFLDRRGLSNSESYSVKVNDPHEIFRENMKGVDRSSIPISDNFSKMRPIDVFVEPKCKEDVWNGAYFSLVKLWGSDNNVNQTSVKLDGDSIVVYTQNSKKAKAIENIFEWLDLWRVYQIVALQNPVLKEREKTEPGATKRLASAMLSYEQFVCQLANKGADFLHYDDMFRRLKPSRPMIDWDTIDNELKATSISRTQTNASADISPQMNASMSLSSTKPSTAQNYTGSLQKKLAASDILKQFPSLDRYDIRPGVCFSYVAGMGCRAGNSCKFAPHCCPFCGMDHSVFQCPVPKYKGQSSQFASNEFVQPYELSYEQSYEKQWNGGQGYADSQRNFPALD